MLKRASMPRSRASGWRCPRRCGWLIAAAIKLEDGGPVFYRQERVGLGGRPFAR